MIFLKSSRRRGHGSNAPLLLLMAIVALCLNAARCQNQNLFQNRNNNGAAAASTANDDEDQYDMMSENDNESSGNGQDGNDEDITNNNNAAANSYEEELVKSPAQSVDKSPKKPVVKQSEKTPELEKKSQETQQQQQQPLQQQAKPQSITQKDYDATDYDQEQSNDYEQDSSDYDADKDASKTGDDADDASPSDEPQAAPSTSTPYAAVDNQRVTYQSSGSKLFIILTKPGIMAGIVGGAIIGVLTAILLIMFIVYRMRKKDEGSYALEETKKPLNAYDYRNCPTREFYAWGSISLSLSLCRFVSLGGFEDTLEETRISFSLSFFEKRICYIYIDFF